MCKKNVSNKVQSMSVQLGTYLSLEGLGICKDQSNSILLLPVDLRKNKKQKKHSNNSYAQNLK